MIKYVLQGYLEKKSAWYNNPWNTAALGAGIGGLGGGIGRYLIDPEASTSDIVGTSLLGALGGGGLGYAGGKYLPGMFSQKQEPKEFDQSKYRSGKAFSNLWGKAREQKQEPQIVATKEIPSQKIKGKKNIFSFNSPVTEPPINKPEHVIKEEPSFLDKFYLARAEEIMEANGIIDKLRDRYSTGINDEVDRINYLSEIVNSMPMEKFIEDYKTSPEIGKELYKKYHKWNIVHNDILSE